MEYINNLLMNLGVHASLAVYLTNIIMVIGIVLLSILANMITKRLVLRVLTHYIHNNQFKWDNYLLEWKVIHKLSHVVPAIIIYYFSFMFPIYQSLIEKGVVIYMIVVAILVLDAFLSAVNAIYMTYEVSKVKPIRGYLQVVKIFIYIVGGILIISSLIGESPIILLSGIGALSAVIMLIFKDSILGLVAGVQLSSNDMVRVGDWIEMPKYGADGDIIDISLNTVKVQNWDKTITTIPTYALISDSFKNWRGMQKSGGRRIKRSINVDISSITFCTSEMIESFKKIQYLRDYITQREQEIEQYNREKTIDRSSKVNGRTMTNIGVFRTYIQQYLNQHPQIHKDMTCMVRQLASSETGLPIEIYAFTNDTNWSVYEGIQSDIFDHILAVAPDFGLRVFQNPTGHDMKSLLENSESNLHSVEH
ncbi:mechanosensitive ion channel family protein [Paenibacillus sp. N1-5-1-14]|uniref:mechanosensitive ion channel family protein n=1 Tax=Paenibacillus radicibacter TaxID=2972488 RepID=UPI002159955E|nr:mechanosensitive ion channel family protein [Paenibacillus radicibacter]MCR8645984.1 mechanosensitive ion channel family protein [Paenibacillus radicibacter]